MADAATSVVRYFEKKNGIIYVAIMTNISTYCDCAAIAPPGCMEDIGICASLDPVAIDQACIDQVLASPDQGKKELIERINQLNGIRTLKRAYEHKIGNREYDLIDLSGK